VATTYFQIFASRVSLTLIDQPAVLCQAILYLASKSEEEHRRLRDIISVVHVMKYPEAELLHLGPEHSALRDHIVTTEQLVLRVLGFNLNVNLPYGYLYNMLKSLNASPPMARLANACLNDLYPFSIILEYDAPLLAAAAIFMGVQLASSHQSKDNANYAKPTIGGGETKIDPNSTTLALDCVKALDIDPLVVMEIARRMMQYYELPPVIPFTFEPRKEVSQPGGPTAQ
jgi:hypothetical protein